MPFHIRDPETDSLVRELAASRGVGVTEAVKMAARETLEAQKRAGEPSLWEKVKAIQDKIASYPRTGLEADRAFYDSLNDE